MQPPPFSNVSVFTVMTHHFPMYYPPPPTLKFVAPPFDCNTAWVVQNVKINEAKRSGCREVIPGGRSDKCKGAKAQSGAHKKDL